MKAKYSQNRHGRFQPKNGNWIYKVDRLAIYLRDGFCCGYCGADLKGVRPDLITLDHLKPISLFPPHTSKKVIHHPSNLITACKSCNCSRQVQPWFKYATGGAKERIQRLRYLSLTRFRKMAKAIFADRARNAACESPRAQEV